MPATNWPSDHHRPSRLACLGVGFLVLAVLGCSHPQDSSNSSQVMQRGLSGEPATLDPAASGDTFSHEVLEDLYEGLTSESPSGEVIPGVASSWSVDASGRLYTFRLRPAARWSNGKPVRAQDFIAAWQRALDPKQASPDADDLRLISGASGIISGKSPVSALGVEADGEGILIVHLEEPAPYFLQLLSHSASYPIYSDTSARSHGPTSWVSNGAYVLASWSPGTKVELIKNPYYWNRTAVLIPRVDYVFATDANAQFDRYRAGELDMTDNVPENVAERLRRERSTELITSPILITAYYGLNL